MVRTLRSALVALVLVGCGTALVVGEDKKNIVETAVAAKSFNTLVTAVKTAGLVETLSGPGPFTVFAPTDEAFAKLGQETIDAVLKNKEQLTAILKLHVVSGKVMANQVTSLREAQTLNGKLPIKVEGGNVMIGKAKVVKTDIECTNGVIHVIDTVLLPGQN
ncbi:MAG TPA: fasciclin domain-containing protein [Gemmatales bacterium]|nr:fasciclin domain-containing protein [Gemmatales bacterium]HMP58109.1 fasciclin domain-containing protein [Gemmatales bacterium]